MRIIILHGWGHDKTYWNDFIAMYGSDAEIVALDLPGFGQEPLVSSDWGVPEYAEWVKKKIEDIKLTDVVILGHSFGGRIASWIAKENPTWLKALILYGAPSIYRPSLTIRLKIGIYKFLKKLGLRRLKSTNTELNNADSAGLGKIFRKIVSFDQTEELKEIKVPTLIIWGENDETTPLRIGEEMHTLIKTSELAVLKNLGHNAHLENPNIFYGTIKKYVENL